MVNRDKAYRIAHYMRLYDSWPSSDVDPEAPYRVEDSYDGRATWTYPRQSTGQLFREDIVEALLDGCQVDYRGAVCEIESPYPLGGWIRYTRAS
ncbi:hypothetical protein [Streptomyces sp. NPDC058045]|uniref:hypothetical protein n=1 Tax=Streptomyces sp. NPDC058045 TaxID=3346311 RepID=UPI0036E8D583